jgi:TatD DNase family protein
MVPDDRFFLETDMIAETIFDVYNLAAKYKNTTVENIQNTIAANFKAVFKSNDLKI